MPSRKIQQLDLPMTCESLEARASVSDNCDDKCEIGGRNDRDSLDEATHGATGVRFLQPSLTTSLGLLFATDCFNLFAWLKDNSIACLFPFPPFNLVNEFWHGAVQQTACERA